MLVLSLYILDRLLIRSPRKQQVLRFIRSRGLIQFHFDDDLPRATGEPKWMNDFAWAREDIKRRGFLTMPEFGVWRITVAGKQWVEEKAKRWVELSETNPASKDEFLSQCRRINELFFSHMVFLGQGRDIIYIPRVAPAATNA